VKKNTSFWLAVFVAPLTVPAYVVVMSLFRYFSLYEIHFGSLAIVAAVSYIGFFVFGLPFVLILRSKDKLTLTALFLGGVIAGPLFHVFWSILSGEELAFRWEYFQVLVMMTVLSVGVAIVFGLIAKARIS
jgi:hypothetical protein